MSAPRVSIVTAAYNAAATLPRVFASVAQQRVRDWEHIVVVDGATDETAAVVRDAAARDRRIRLIEQENAGASVARNTGLSAARGEWILFLDADDTLDRRHLSRMLARAASEDAEVVCCGYDRRDLHGRVTERYSAPKFFRSPFRAIVASPPTVIHGVLARRALVAEVGGFDPELRTNEDWDLWLRLARSTDAFAREPARLAHYWNAEQSLTRDPAAMVRDVAIVLTRAAKPDPRVPHPLPPYANGVSLGTHDENLLACALWSAASEIARGDDGMAAIGALPERMAQPWNPGALSYTMFDGLMVGSGGRLVDVARAWKRYAARITAMLAAVEERCSAPGLAYALLRELEWDVGRLARLPERTLIGDTLSVRLTPSALLRGIDPPPGAEVIQFHPIGFGSNAKLMFHAPAIGALSARDVRHGLARELWRRGLRMGGAAAKARPALGKAIDRGLMGLALAGRVPRRLRRRRPVEQIEPMRVDEPAAGEGSTEGWDAFFGAEDPWNYGSAYEQLKYQRTLDLLPARPIGRAIELACAEGMFTRLLAPRVERLTATDISQVALDRAAARCAGGPTPIDFAVLDFFNQPLGDGWDLIVSSEVLYYMAGREALTDYAERVAAALAPDGLFLHAHAFEVSDDPSHTGFDWDDPFGADTISATFRAQAGLERVRALTTDLYLIELYRRIPPTHVVAHAPTEKIPLGTELEPNIAAMVVWNGAIRTRPQVEREERTARLPVLMYHQVAETGPEALARWRVTPHDFEHQLRYLRRRGYRSITVEEWEDGARNSASLRGRPVLITFDDAYENFRDIAWPILERNGFSALMFAVTGRMGQAADWDAHLAPPTPIMDWESLIDLHRRGLQVGSHLHNHLASDRVPVRRLYDEAIRSKALLEEKLGVPVTSVAPPFGAMNIRVEQVLRAAGYTRIFDAEGSLAPVWGTRWRVPRIDIGGGVSIDNFAALIGRGDEPPDAGDRP